MIELCIRVTEQSKSTRGCMGYYPTDRVPDVWYKQHAVLIGDAAHNLPPILHQVNTLKFTLISKGASQALQDAYTLGKSLSECGI